MFGKTKEAAKREAESAPLADVSARKPACAPSLFGQGLVFEGQLTGDGEIHIEGEVRGEINLDRVVVGENARVTGVIRGEQVIVRGQVEGAIEARSVKLFETARVHGDIVHEQLSIDTGALFEGRCRQAQPKPTAEVIELDKSALG
jgi:cytoskeletal protein CcmA (bactofilin family)